MKTQRFFALTARDALSQVRESLGPDAIILSNRSVNNGVEILASDEREFALAIEESNVTNPPQLDHIKPEVIQETPTTNDISAIMEEIRSMRGSLENQLSALSWTSQQHQHPAKSGILRELLAMGFSASLSRYLAENVPAEMDIEQGLQWSKDTLMRNLSIITNEDHFLDQGGVFALVGPTGVGKTTTTAKLAARCVMRHGASKLGLITTDSYRIGAHEQLRIYGKILGVMIHSVRDETDLHIALDELKNKHTVIIDTVGMSQRDQMVAEQIAMLSGARNPIKRILCMNATSTIETLNEVVTSYRGSGLTGCILTKLDEAVTLSNALDVILRQKLKLFYVGTGQRVPEDLHLIDAEKLVGRAFQHRHAKSATRYEESELPLLMTNDTTHSNPSKQTNHVK
jgi:flagellar biosynthesis protein FlhF